MGEMSTLCKELVFLILQFLEEEGWKDAARALERNTGYFFNMEHFEELVLKGDWVGAEEYLSGFTKFDDNKHSTKIYFEMRKHNFFEALDNNERAKALDILVKDLKVFAPENQELFKDLTQLLILDNIREHGSLSMYTDTETARTIVLRELRKLIRANPIFQGKVDFPCIRGHRLRRIVNQSLNWQHLQCKFPQPEPNIRTLFVDHVCSPPDEHIPFAVNAVVSQSTSSSLTSTVTDSEISSTTRCPGTGIDLYIFDLCLLIKLFCLTCEQACLLRSSPCYFPVTNRKGCEVIDSASQEVTFETFDKEKQSVIPSGQASLISPLGFCNNHMDNTVVGNRGLTSMTELPTIVARTLTGDFPPTSMAFHPIHHTHLLVGTNSGEIGLWDVSSGEKLITKIFRIWNINACTMVFKTALLRDPHVSVNCVTWSQDGSLLGVAYSKHIVQIHAYHGGNDIRQKLEIDAHVGGVSDLAFSVPHELSLIITCGDDRIIQFFFSTSVDGKIKAWLYDDSVPRIDYDAPGLASTTMLYIADGRRLLSCGTNNSGESYLVEWDDSEGTIIRSYQGLQKSSSGAVKFDVMKDQFVAAGHDHVIKVWNLDSDDLLTIIDAEGDLPENPQVRFNKDGTLLAVFAKGNKIKILASHSQQGGSQYTEAVINTSVEEAEASNIPILEQGGSQDTEAVINTSVEEAEAANIPRLEQGGSQDTEPVINTSVEEAEAANIPKPIVEINSPYQLKTLMLPSYVRAKKIERLVYGGADGIVALASSGIHLIWQWPVNLFNTQQVSTEVAPELRKRRNSPPEEEMMTNDLTENPDPDALPCLDISNNLSYLISASGGKISLFNMLTMKTMASVLPPKPTTTCLIFHPIDNNIIIIGRDDWTILIHNLRKGKSFTVLYGHTGRVSGLAFSTSLNRLVSSGADAQIRGWSTEPWERQGTRTLEIPEGVKSDTYVQFHPNQIQFLAVHKAYMGVFVPNNLERVAEWIPKNTAYISQAAYSCDGRRVYAGFMDGTLGIFDSQLLELRCRIAAEVVVPPRLDVYPSAITAHPGKPNQFVVGFTDGAVVVFEPPSPNAEWWMDEDNNDDGDQDYNDDEDQDDSDDEDEDSSDDGDEDNDDDGNEDNDDDGDEDNDDDRDEDNHNDGDQDNHNHGNHPNYDKTGCWN
ncbi:Topless-related protein 4 [Linum perenne]